MEQNLDQAPLCPPGRFLNDWAPCFLCLQFNEWKDLFSKCFFILIWLALSCTLFFFLSFFQLHRVILLEQGWSLEVGMDMGLASVLILLWDLWDLSMYLMTGRQGDFTLGLVIGTKVFFAWLFSVLDVSYTCLTNFIVLLGTCTVSGEIVSFNFIFIKPLKRWTPSGILIYSSTKN